MKTIRSLDDLHKFREVALARKRQATASAGLRVTVGLGTCGIAAGAQDVFKAFEGFIHDGLLPDATLSQTGCIGLCRHEPIVEISAGDAPRVTYGRVTPQAAERILREHLLGGRVVEELVIDTTPFPTI